MSYIIWLILGCSGIITGVLAGFLGIGGGVVLVPLLVFLGYTPVNAVATSTLAILITALSGTFQNWRMGYIQTKPVLYLGIPAILTAQLGVYLATKFPPYFLLASFGCLLLLNIYLVELRKQILSQSETVKPGTFNPALSRLATGGAAGILAGLFGVGGGVIMVPLQMLLLGEAIKVAIQTSLGVVVITAVSACIGHAIKGNVFFGEGIVLGTGGLLGAQLGTRFLPKLSDRVVSLAFRSMLGILAISMFWQAWNSYWHLSPRR